MWNASKNTLLLPVTLKESSTDDLYRSIDFFNGLLSVQIEKNTGIKEISRLTHIDTSSAEQSRIQECSKYS